MKTGAFKCFIVLLYYFVRECNAIIGMCTHVLYVGAHMNRLIEGVTVSQHINRELNLKPGNIITKALFSSLLLGLIPAFISSLCSLVTVCVCVCLPSSHSFAISYFFFPVTLSSVIIIFSPLLPRQHDVFFTTSLLCTVYESFTTTIFM